MNLSNDVCLSLAAPWAWADVFGFGFDIEDVGSLLCSLVTREVAPAARIDRIDLGSSLLCLVEVVAVGDGVNREGGDASPAGLDEMTIASKTPASS